MVEEFYCVCTRRKLKLNVGKSKVFERREIKVLDFNTSYRVSVPAVGRCEVILVEKIEEVKEFSNW